MYMASHKFQALLHPLQAILSILSGLPAAEQCQGKAAAIVAQIELMTMDGITWSIHFWLGSCVLAGIVGLVLSYLLVPPQRPVEVEQK